jgi:hypothetical protein
MRFFLQTISCLKIGVFALAALCFSACSEKGGSGEDSEKSQFTPSWPSGEGVLSEPATSTQQRPAGAALQTITILHQDTLVSLDPAEMEYFFEFQLH